MEGEDISEDDSDCSDSESIDASPILYNKKNTSSINQNSEAD